MNINYSPLVTEENRIAWERYSVDNQGPAFFNSLVHDAVQRQLQDSVFNSTLRHLQELELYKTIHGFYSTPQANGSLVGTAPKGAGPYLPLWQLSPVVPSGALVNFNALSHPIAQKSCRETLRTGQAVIDFAENLNKEEYGNTLALVKVFLSLGQYRDVVSDFLEDPSS